LLLFCPSPDGGVAEGAGHLRRAGVPLAKICCPFALFAAFCSFSGASFVCIAGESRLEIDTWGVFEGVAGCFDVGVDSGVDSDCDFDFDFDTETDEHCLWV
jgi:hypothetical protein